MTILEDKLKKASKEFREKIESEIENKTTTIQRSGKKIDVNVTNKNMVDFSKKICPTNFNTDLFVKHFRDIERYLPLCSSKESFAASKKHTRKILDKHNAEELRKLGANFIPIRPRADRILYHHEPGLEYGKPSTTSNFGLITAIRHSEGDYEDEIDDMGFFTYQPPTNQNGFLRYRWIQFLKQKYGIPIFFLAIRWFELGEEIAPNVKFVFMITPVTVVSAEEQKNKKTFFKTDNDLENIGKSIGHPLPLKMITVDEAINVVYDLDIEHSPEPIFQSRARLNEDLTRDYDYKLLTKNELGKKIKRWAQKNRKKCPDGQKCRNELFDSMTQGEIAFGHISSQKWCNAFKFDIKDHPYNLYLTCKSCNSALNEFFPNKHMQKKIDEEEATIGDWARQYDTEIRQS